MSISDWRSDVALPISLLGGTLAGGLTLSACQLLALYVVVPPTQSFAILNPADGVSLALTTVAEGLVLWATAAYRSAAYRVVDAETRRDRKSTRLNSSH